MNTWIIGSVAVLIWLAATALYLKKSIVAAVAERRMRRKMLAEARAKYQAELAAQKPSSPPG